MQIKEGQMETQEFLKARLSEDDYRKLARIDNPALHSFIAKYIELC